MWKGQSKGRNGVSKQRGNALRFAVVNHLLNTVCWEPSLISVSTWQERSCGGLELISSFSKRTFYRSSLSCLKTEAGKWNSIPQSNL